MEGRKRPSFAPLEVRCDGTEHVSAPEKDVFPFQKALEVVRETVSPCAAQRG